MTFDAAVEFPLRPRSRASGSPRSRDNHHVSFGDYPFMHPTTSTQHSMPDSEIQTEHQDTPLPARPAGWPQLDASALHGLPGRIVRTIAPHTEADPVALLGHTLAQFSCAIGRKPCVVLDGGPSPLGFNPVFVGESSKARKGTADKRIRRLFEMAMPSWKPGSAALSSGEGLVNAVRDANPLLSDPGVTDKRLYLVQSEFGSTLKIMAREGNSLSGVIRDAFDGQDLDHLVKNSRIRATKPHIVIVGHVTKEELLKYLNDTEKCNGFGNRFVWLVVRRTRLIPFPTDPEQQILTALAEDLKGVISDAQTVGEVGLSGQARDHWKRVYPFLSEGKPGRVGALLGRGEAHVRRMAALYALFDRKTEADQSHLKAAIAYWQYSEDSTLWIFSRHASSEVEVYENRLLRAVVKAGELDETNISTLFGHNLSAARLDQVKQNLKREGLLHSVEIKTGGRPRLVWRPGGVPAPEGSAQWS